MKHALCCLTLLLSAMSVSAADSPRPPVAIVPDDGPVTATTGLYVYDPSGNVAAIGNNSYLYDPMGRVTKASVDRLGDVQSQTYTYDVYGNRTSDGLSYPADVNTNRLTGVAAQYDAAGNLTQWQPPGSTRVRTYSYDALNTVTRDKVTVNGTTDPYVLQIYTADDERYWSLTGGDPDSAQSRYALRDLGGRVLREYVETTDTGTTTWSARDYVYRDGLLLASHDTATDTTYHYSLDHLGTPRVVTNQNHVRVAEHTYFPFGAEYFDDGPTDGRLHFTGHEQRDADLLDENRGELDYMHARYYSPTIGRVLSVDPVWDFETAMKEPQMWNRYAYALNNPMKYIDPTGEVVDLASLSPDERNQLLLDLNAFTGNEYGVNRNGELTVINYGQNASATATAFLDSAIGATATYGITSSNSSGVIFAEANTATNQITFDFKDFSKIDYNGINPTAFGPGAILAHELAHVHPQSNGQTLGDGPVALRTTQVGPTETFVNQIRTERGFPHRGPAYEGRWGGFFGNRVLVNFQVGRRIVDVSAREYH